MSNSGQTTSRRFNRSTLVGLLIGVFLGGGGVYLSGVLNHEHGAGMEARAEAPYHCPMHPGVTSPRPGSCPICGMDLVQAELEVQTGPGAGVSAQNPEKAQARYVCPMHPNYASTEAGTCPICGMDLVFVEAPSGADTAHGHPGLGPTAGTSPMGNRKIAYYRSPMDPKITSPGPTKDSMGMDFFPVYENEVQGAGEPVEGLATVTIDPQRQQLIGLRLAPVTAGPVGGGFRTTGRVAIDETRIARVNVKVQGYVEEVFADFVGKAVTRGQPLFSIYSPEMVAVQHEYLLALKTRSSFAEKGALVGTGEDIVAAALEHIAHWDIPPAIIRQLERTGVPLRAIPVVAPISGIVTAKTIVDGTPLSAGDTPYEITDLSSVWVLADVYESDIARVRRGTPAELTLKAFPTQTFSGTVTFIDPLMDPKTRTVKVRLEVPNPRGDLRPEMFGEVHLRTEERLALRIPFDAMVDSGQHKVVFVAREGGKFEPREIQTGVRCDEHIEVLSGLKRDESVVSGAAFLVDSESRLRSALTSMGAPSPGGAAVTEPAPSAGPAFISEETLPPRPFSGGK